MLSIKNLPAQQLPFRKKDKDWRKAHLEWADKRTFFYDNTVRKSILKKRINYNLINGIVDMEDMTMILNPDNIDASYIPSAIQHYPIMNSKINVLRGEESKRRFNFKVRITNPNAIGEKEKEKKNAMYQKVQELVENQGLSEEEMAKEIESLRYFFTYEWQDMREIRGNYLLNHYMKELAIPLKFNHGFVDAMVVGEEIYQCDIVGGEPTIEKVNPMKIHAFRNGYSSKIEDSDIIILIDYWSPGKIQDTYYDVLTKKDMEYLENMQVSDNTEMANTSEIDSFVNVNDISLADSGDGGVIDSFVLFGQSLSSGLGTNFYDNNGNIRVLRVYWKSKRKIKKVKTYNDETGEEEFAYFDEGYSVDETKGEEEQVFWINEAWEGTKIGKDIYVNMRPRLVQYNRLSNPSRCHFGIVGSIYNVNDSKPYSLVDHAKPFVYLYDVIHDRLNKAIASNWGKLAKLDLAMIPKNWEIDKWLYYAKINKLAVVDSFKEGNEGMATGKLAGMMNNQSSGVIDAETGDYIQHHLSLLEVIKMEMSEAMGISKQREGQISNRETVGGVERANLQSSHITELYFIEHDDVKRRALECFLETAKVALKGNSKKFQYILPDGSEEIIDIDGDEFAECDYGLVVDGSAETEKLASNLEELAKIALQNQTLSMSAIMKIWTSPSLSEIQRIIERDERDMIERKQQSEDNQNKVLAQVEEAKLKFEYDKIEADDVMNQRDNETKIIIAASVAEAGFNDGVAEVDPSKKAELMEKIRQWDLKFAFDKKVHDDDVSLKKKDLEIKSRKAITKSTVKA